MPWKSIAQARWGHSPAGIKALGGKAAVSEWDQATPKGSLKEGSHTAKHWIQKAIKHPGRMKRAAKKAGLSTQQYMHKHAGDSGSTGAAARLGLRLSKMNK